MCDLTRCGSSGAAAGKGGDMRRRKLAAFMAMLLLGGTLCADVTVAEEVGADGTRQMSELTADDGERGEVDVESASTNPETAADSTTGGETSSGTNEGTEAAVTQEVVAEAEAGDASEDAGEFAQTEAPLFVMTLPYYEGITYEYDESRLPDDETDGDMEDGLALPDSGTANPGAEMHEDICLEYIAGEEVSFALQYDEASVQIDHLTLESIDELGAVIAVDFSFDENEISFAMPSCDVDFTMDVKTIESERAEEVSEPTEYAENDLQQGEIDATVEPETQDTAAEITAEPETQASVAEVAPEAETQATGAEVIEEPEVVMPETLSGEEEEIKEAYREETDASDGLPTQGSIIQVDGITLALGETSFDAAHDSTNITYDADAQTMSYVSDDINPEMEGMYSSIYRIDDKKTGKFWFILRPVTVVAGVETEEVATEVVTEEAEEVATETTEVSEEAAEGEFEEDYAQDEASESEPNESGTVESAPGESGAVESEPGESEMAGAEDEILSNEADDSEAHESEISESETGQEAAAAAENAEEAAEEVTEEGNTEEETEASQESAESDDAGEAVTDEASEEVAVGKITLHLYDSENTSGGAANSAASLAGAVYMVYSDEEMAAAVSTLTTDESGLALAEELAAGTYYVSETKAPVGYRADTNVYILEITDEEPSRSVSAAREVICGDVIIYLASDDGDTESEGVTYALTHEDPEVEPVEVTSGSDGVAQTVGDTLAYGTWTANAEGIAPVTFRIEEDGRSVFVLAQPEAESEAESQSEDTGLTSVSIEVRLLDPEGNLLTGAADASFRLTDAEGNGVALNANGQSTSDDGTFIVGKTGSTVIFANLAEGTYTMSCDAVPAGYSFSSEEDQIRSIHVGTAGMSLTCDFVLQGEPGQITACAVDGEGTVLAYSDFSFELLDQDGKRVATANAGEDGIAVFSDIEAGNYRVREVGCADTYALNSDPVSVELAGESARAEIKTERTSVDLYKYAADDEGLKLSGATYRLIDLTEDESGTIREITDKITEYRSTQNEAVLELLDTTENFSMNLSSDADYESLYDEYVAALIRAYREDTQAAIDSDLADAGYASLDEISVAVLTTDEEGHIHLPSGDSGCLKHSHTYRLVETGGVSGYNADTEAHDFTVDENGLIDGLTNKTFRVSNTRNNVLISVYGIDGELLSGVTLSVCDAAGEEVAAWSTADENPKEITGLSTGKYTVKETAVPGNYTKAEDREFELTDSTTTAEVRIDHNCVDVPVSIIDGDTGEYLSGIKAVISSADGTVAEWETDGNVHTASLPAGTYTLTVTDLDDSMVTPEEVVFEGETDTVIRIGEDREEAEQVEMKIYKLLASVRLLDREDGSFIEGAQLQILDAEGKEVETWTSAGEAHQMNLPTGSYTLIETQAAEPYATAASIRFTITDTSSIQKVTMYNGKITVSISKKAEDSEELLSGAALLLTDADGEVIESWGSQGEAHVMNMAAGEYTLTETAAPDGYGVSEPVTIKVADSEEVQEFTMTDPHITVKIWKKDSITKEAVSGAGLVLKDASGQNAASWTSGTDAAEFHINAGTYTLTEQSVPEGYLAAEPMTITVESKGGVQEFTMYDSQKETTVDLTGKKKTVKTGSKTGSGNSDGNASGSGGSSAGYVDGSDGKANVTTSGAKTGDYFRYAAAIALLILGGLMLIKGSLKSKKDGKEESSEETEETDGIK